LIRGYLSPLVAFSRIYILQIVKLIFFFQDLSSSTDKQVSTFYAAVLEYMLLDILKLTTNYLQNLAPHRTEITHQDVKIAMFADKVCGFPIDLLIKMRGLHHAGLLLRSSATKFGDFCFNIELWQSCEMS